MKESVGGAYLQWAMGLEQVRMLQQLDSSYSSMAAFATKRFELGETGRLEKTSAQSRAEQVKLRLRQAQADLLAYQAEVERWSGLLNGASPLPEELLTTARVPILGGGQRSAVGRHGTTRASGRGRMETATQPMGTQLARRWVLPDLRWQCAVQRLPHRRDIGALARQRPRRAH